MTLFLKTVLNSELDFDLGLWTSVLNEGCCTFYKQSDSWFWDTQDCDMRTSGYLCELQRTGTNRNIF